MYKVAIVSLGCSKNLVDTEMMLGSLKNKGYELADLESEADIIIVNTCCFIEDAKMESIEMILELSELKKENCKAIIVTGCMAQRYKDEILTELPEVDAVATIGADLEKAIEAAAGGSREVIKDRWDCGEYRVQTTPEYMAYLKIAEGCDNRCTYCVIPSVRGRLRSRPLEDLVQEAKMLCDSGVKELVVIAQDTTSYGVDIYGESRLCELIDRLCELDFVWIRLQYCYPEKITDELIDTIAKQEKVCNYLDLPIQHCEDRILKAMGRKGSKQELINLIDKLRAKIPGIILRTTLITGFPGETEEEFESLCEFVNDMEFDRLGAFAYSQEEGTPAAEMDGQLPDEVKQQRQETVMLLQSEIAEELNKERIGKTYTVVLEGYDEIIKRYYGRTYADSPEVDTMVFAAGKKGLPEGTFAKVKITDAMDYDLYGDLEE